VFGNGEEWIVGVERMPNVLKLPFTNQPDRASYIVPHDETIAFDDEVYDVYDGVINGMLFGRSLLAAV